MCERVLKKHLYSLVYLTLSKKSWQRQEQQQKQMSRDNHRDTVSFVRLSRQIRNRTVLYYNIMLEVSINRLIQDGGYEAEESPFFVPIPLGPATNILLEIISTRRKARNICEYRMCGRNGEWNVKFINQSPCLCTVCR